LSCFSFASFKVFVSAVFETNEGGSNGRNKVVDEEEEEEEEEEEDKDFDFIIRVRWDNVKLIKIIGELLNPSLCNKRF